MAGLPLLHFAQHSFALPTLVGWNGWPQQEPDPSTRHVPPHHPPRRPARPALRPILGLCLTYGLNAFGLVPHMVFLVDYIARGLGEGLDAGTHYWVLFGLGAIIGPVVLGHVADRIGHRPALRITLFLEVVFVTLPALDLGEVALVASSAVVGACTIGVVPVVLGRTREILHHHPASQPGAWRTATIVFALFQAAGAYFLSFLFARTGDYRLLFLLGGTAMAAALIVQALPTPDAAPEEAG